MSKASKRQSPLSLTVRLVCLLMLCGFVPTLGVAQSPAEKIKLENKIPAHLPLKVEVKNLQNEQWERDLEVVVENTGDKPIYYLRLGFVMPEMKDEAGKGAGFPLKYGRSALVSLSNRAQPEDVPIKPGERHIFKFEEQYILGYQHFKARLGLPNPTRVILFFIHLSFGDGTGFGTTGGLPLPNKRASITNCGDDKQDTMPKRADISFPLKLLSSSFLQTSFSFLPVIFSSAFLSLQMEHSTFGGVSPQDTCCHGTNCSFLEVLEDGYTCLCGDADYVQTAPCYSANGSCGTSGNYPTTCIRGGERYLCPVFYINPCGSPDIE